MVVDQIFLQSLSCNSWKVSADVDGGIDPAGGPEANLALLKVWYFVTEVMGVFENEKYYCGPCKVEL